VTLAPASWSIGRTLAECGFEALGVQVQAVRRRGAKAKLSAEQAGPLEAGDVLLLLGVAEALSLAEERLLRG
jgi:CPA2 family monovalent cation:H+ antiporter-2